MCDIQLFQTTRLRCADDDDDVHEYCAVREATTAKVDHLMKVGNVNSGKMHLFNTLMFDYLHTPLWYLNGLQLNRRSVCKAGS